jgi:hypothetical protein
MSDGEIWTAHGGVNPCGLFVRRGDRELRTRWLCKCSTRKLRRDTRTKRFYTGSGLWRVKSYVQFFGLYCWCGEITWRPVDGLLVSCDGLSPGGRPCPPYIGRRTRSVDRSPNRLQQGNLSLVDYNSCHILSICFRRSPLRPCLVLYAKSWGRVGLGRLGDSSGRSSGGHVGYN